MIGNKIGYKIVRSRAGKLLSFLHEEIPDVWVVEYKPGEWARPTIGKLFAWEVEPPKIFGPDQLWLAELENPSDIHDWVISPYNSSQILEEYIPKFWRGSAWKRYFIQEHVRTFNLVRGTVTCDAIKLLERVQQ